MITNVSALVEFMGKVKGCKICTIDAVTCPKMNKVGNPYYGRVLKYTRTQMQFGYNYENAVNNRLEKMGLERSFVACSRSWGEWVVPNKIATNKGKMYIRFYTFESNTPCETYYLIDGRLATKAEVEAIKGYMPKASVSKTQEAEGLVEHQVKPREYEASTIKRISINGEEIFVNRELAEVVVK